MTDRSDVGIIGVGLLGSAIAERLIAGGIAVCGFDAAADQRELLTSLGGVAARDPAEVAQRCRIVITCLPTSQTVNKVLESLAREWQPGQIVIDSSTGDPSEMMAIEAILARQDVRYVEAMVAGSSTQVRAGQVVLFVGGDAATLDTVQPVLCALTATHFHLGPVGAASRFKLVHNLLLGLHRAVLAEGLTFAEALGFDPAETLNILQQTPAASEVMSTKGMRMVTRDFSPQAKLVQHLKDVRLILAAAEDAGCQTPLSQLHRSLLDRARELGWGDADNSAIIEAFRQPT